LGEGRSLQGKIAKPLSAASGVKTRFERIFAITLFAPPDRGIMQGLGKRDVLSYCRTARHWFRP